MPPKELFILPISHIAPESRSRVREEMNRIAPDILAIELDPQRLIALLEERRTGKRRENFSLFHLREFILVFVLSKVQKFLAEKISQVPGEEFLVGIDSAVERRIPVALVDRDISVTVKRLLSELKLSVIGKLLWFSLFGKGGKIEIDIARVPDERIVRKLLFQLKREFPGIYKALVSERDAFIAGEIGKIPEEKRVLLIVGAAHVQGLRRKFPEAKIL